VILQRTNHPILLAHLEEQQETLQPHPRQDCARLARVRSQHIDVAEAAGSDYTNVVQLDRSEYTEVR